MRLKVLTVAAALLSASLAAHADDIYTFTIDVPNTPGIYGIQGSYTFDEPSLVTTAGYLSLSDLTSYSGAAISSFYLDPDYFTCPYFISPGAESCFEAQPIGGTLNSFAGTEVLNAPGTYDETASALYVTITGPNSLPSPTPEPSGIVLLGTGLLGVVGMIKRRFI